jgi:putative transposase
LRRYLAQYRSEGFSGLKPNGRKSGRISEAIPVEILEQAILLRRQVPSRSITQIIQILEWEGLAEPGQIKRSTLQEKLAERGYSARHMKLYAESGTSARRYQRKYRNQLWHSDLKYGPYLPIGAGGQKKQVYLVIFIDDATRFVLHGQFYPMMDQIIVEDSFRQSILKYGVPERVYFDNGSQYRTKWMTRACSKMGIRLLYARPYSPESTGKPERFNRFVDSFLAEVSLEKPQTLDRLNQLFAVWLEECYQHKPHSGLSGNITPHTAYQSDKQPLRYIDPEIMASAFMHCEDRKVDKSGCISFQGRKYEVGLNFIGCKVSVIYDPANTSELTIEYEGHKPVTARPMVIGEHSGKRPKLPEHLQAEPVDSSRLLNAAGKKNQARKATPTPVVSYRTIRKEGRD